MVFLTCQFEYLLILLRSEVVEEIVDGVDLFAVENHLIVEVRPRGKAGAADGADLFAALDTATGTHGKAGRTIAVDPSIIPYGSRVLVGGYVFIAEDTGSAIRGRHIDLFMDTHEVAMQFGRREGEVFLIR